MACSKRYNFDPTLPGERRRLVLTISPVHWAAEWLRPVSPNFKLVGPILAGPGNPLPEHIEVTPLPSCRAICQQGLSLRRCLCQSTVCAALIISTCM